MNKFAISLIALAALSTAALASGNRSWDLRDSETYVGKYATQLKDTAATSSDALAVQNPGQPLSNFERMKLNQIKNESSSH